MNAERPTTRRGFLRGALAALAAGSWLGRSTSAGAVGAGTQGTEPYVGEMRLFAGSAPPGGWLFCEGQLLPIAEFETLFFLIGTIYGGDGQETFALPDLRGRVPIHRGTGPNGVPYVLGEMAGSNAVTLNPQQMPIHTHPLAASSAPGDSDSPVGRVPARDASGAPRYAVTADGKFAATAIEPAGGSQPHENRQPFLAVHFMIAFQGIFPSPS